MMYGSEKSDSAIRVKTPANNAEHSAAEWVEQRAGTKGNAGQPHTRRTQSRGGVSQGLDRVRQAARQRTKEKCGRRREHAGFWTV
jgi:RNA-directed DNA polymerase